jgi:hypothetical protein
VEEEEPKEDEAGYGETGSAQTHDGEQVSGSATDAISEVKEADEVIWTSGAPPGKPVAYGGWDETVDVELTYQMPCAGLSTALAAREAAAERAKMGRSGRFQSHRPYGTGREEEAILLEGVQLFFSTDDLRARRGVALRTVAALRCKGFWHWNMDNISQWFRNLGRGPNRRPKGPVSNLK